MPPFRPLSLVSPRAVRWNAATAVLGLCLALLSTAAAAFDFDDVAKRAKALSDKAYVEAKLQLPAELAALDYDQYRDIRFKPDQALWRKEALPFEIMFFHVGAQRDQIVTINEIVDGKAQHVAFDAKLYDYGKNKLKGGWGDLGHAGFRIHYPLNTSSYRDEVAVFLGASYLRAVGRGQSYGLSARGLGIDTHGGPKGEEFPRFREFWLERPAKGATALTIYALLDSPRVAGAYQFVIKPGDDTLTEVKARVYLRAGVAAFGVAPLTSMFQHGENDPRADDFRPEVHDSDGLAIEMADGQWLWRPLINPKRPTVATFRMRDPKGFGLQQRDRAYTSYEDTEARYEKRPSAWVEPVGKWGPGRVEMLSFNTADETTDNVVAYWVPDKLPAPGNPIEFAYKLYWQGDKPRRAGNGWTVQSRRGRGLQALGKGEFQYVVDFAGPALAALPQDAHVDAAIDTGPNARLVERNAYRNPVTGGWRMTLRIQRTAAQPIELRATLQQGNQALTETWTTLIPSD